jgi:hypothetical protein
MAQFQIGSISTGTLRPEDLLPVFIEALTALGGTLPADIECGTHLEYTNLPSYDKVGVIDDDDGFWRSEEAQWDVDALTDALQSRCPPFVYFGTLPGDGADFGFWPDMDRLDEALRWERDHYPDDSVPDELTLDDDGVIVQISDHGNVTVMDMERNVLWDCV